MDYIIIGPYYCARGVFDRLSLLTCAFADNLIQTGALVNKVISAAMAGLIDDPSNLRCSNVFILSGTLDTVVMAGNQFLTFVQCPYEDHRMIHCQWFNIFRNGIKLYNKPWYLLNPRALTVSLKAYIVDF